MEKSTASSSTSKLFSHHGSILNRNKYSSLMRSFALGGTKLSAQVFLSLSLSIYINTRSPSYNWVPKIGIEIRVDFFQSEPELVPRFPSFGPSFSVFFDTPTGYTCYLETLFSLFPQPLFYGVTMWVLLH